MSDFDDDVLGGGNATGTATAPIPSFEPAPQFEPIFDPSNPEGMEWMFQALLSENDALRERVDELERELRMRDLSDVMDWATLPYPLLKAADFWDSRN